MKKLFVASALALALSVAGQQKASAWSEFKFSAGVNMGWVGGGNRLFWGLYRSAPYPGGQDLGPWFPGIAAAANGGQYYPPNPYGPAPYPAPYPVPGAPAPGAPGWQAPPPFRWPRTSLGAILAQTAGALSRGGTPPGPDLLFREIPMKKLLWACVLALPVLALPNQAHAFMVGNYEVDTGAKVWCNVRQFNFATPT